MGRAWQDDHEVVGAAGKIVGEGLGMCWATLGCERAEETGKQHGAAALAAVVVGGGDVVVGAVVVDSAAVFVMTGAAEPCATVYLPYVL